MVEIAPNVSIDPNVHHGAPVITGTRVPISILVGSLAGGMNKEDVSREYQVTIEQIEAALSFAAELVAKVRTTAGAFAHCSATSQTVHHIARSS